ncbi:MAG: 2-(1,2-epoxy-1,2-dihydrophenyl)acetyl-CoA isomerase [Chitinophagales bacterium]|jgi:2-(1,2-epoxy-1,2-dihydrophenyl)acetyl-CoA isomerase
MSDYENIQYQVKNSIATITLNRPNSANSINILLAQELNDVSIKIYSDDSIRAVIITGNGKMFSAGGDLASFAAYGDKISDGLRTITSALHSATSNFARMNKPVITAINGTAAGAGFSLAIAGDFAISADTAKYTLAYTGAGLSPDGSSTYVLPRLVGVRKAMELIITNRVLTAAEALDWGLISEVVATAELMSRANELATQLANGPSAAYGQVKNLLMSSFQNGYETQLQLESDGIANMASTSDGKEGIAAFLEKRKPNFTGK